VVGRAIGGPSREAMARETVARGGLMGRAWVGTGRRPRRVWPGRRGTLGGSRPRCGARGRAQPVAARGPGPGGLGGCDAGLGAVGSRWRGPGPVGPARVGSRTRGGARWREHWQEYGRRQRCGAAGRVRTTRRRRVHETRRNVDGHTEPGSGLAQSPARPPQRAGTAAARATGGRSGDPLRRTAAPERRIFGESP
jgi:hypothetical protein